MATAWSTVAALRASPRHDACSLQGSGSTTAVAASASSSYLHAGDVLHRNGTRLSVRNVLQSATPTTLTVFRTRSRAKCGRRWQNVEAMVRQRGRGGHARDMHAGRVRCAHGALVKRASRVGGACVRCCALPANFVQLVHTPNAL